jgi:hypothetical protein
MITLRQRHFLQYVHMLTQVCEKLQLGKRSLGVGQKVYEVILKCC